MDLQQLADLLFPSISGTLEDWEEVYPKRKLPEGASVTRLGPSPTGFIHLGNLYSAFVDERQARLSDGVMILRIEDTDQKRKVEGSEELIIRSLSHYGINFDEGVTLEGEKGDYGPYRQSERKEIYHTAGKKLVESGWAYPSFMSEEEIGALRRRQEEQKILPGIHGKWASERELTLEEVRENLLAGKEWVLRLKSRGEGRESYSICDGIRGDIRVHPNIMDTVLLKADGLPTYHFAHVVDDHFMRITHIVRGEEWLSTLPIHLEVHEALGWEPPVFCHTSHLLKMDGGNKRKLSKRRDPELSLEYYHQEGYFPEAIREYLMILLNSDYEEWRRDHPDTPLEDFSFRMEDMSSSGALFDMEKLHDVSKDVLLRIPEDEILTYLLDWADRYAPECAPEMHERSSELLRILSIGRDAKKPRKDLIYARQIYQFIHYYLDGGFHIEDPLPERVSREEAIGILEEFLAGYDHEDDNSAWFAKIRAIAQERGFALRMGDFRREPDKYKGTVADVSSVIRLGITGRASSPDLWNIMQIMGEERALKRLEDYLVSLRSESIA